MSTCEERKIERRYMIQERTNIYVACEEYDFTWDECEVSRFRMLWQEGMSIPDMAKELKRHQNEIIILAIDQAEQSRIKPRPGGILGSKLENGVS